MFKKKLRAVTAVCALQLLVATANQSYGSTLEEQTYLGHQYLRPPSSIPTLTSTAKLSLPLNEPDEPTTSFTSISLPTSTLSIAPASASTSDSASTLSIAPAVSISASAFASLSITSIVPAITPVVLEPTVELISKKSKTLLLPAAWAGRDDVINPDLDFQALLAKAKVSGALPIKNNTTASISIHIGGQQHAKKRKGPVELDLTIAAGQTLNVLSLALYESMRLNAGSLGFLNFYSTKSGFKVAVEPQPMLLFPRTLSPFTFVPNKETACLVGATSDEQAKIEQYWAHVGFMRYVCKQETIDPDDFYLQRIRLYEAFKLELMVERPLPYIPRIPLNLFNIWLTNLSNPKEPDQELVDLALASSRINPHNAGWNHFFLVQDPAIFPQTKKALAGSDVRLVSFAELLGPLSLESELAESIADRKFGMASDILRVEALVKMGGGYLDIDLQTMQSLKLYFYAYHSMFGIEPMSEFIGNAFMAASPGHPIMQEMVRLISRNFALKRAGNKAFYSSIPTDGFSTIVQTGPCVSTVAFYNAANREGRTDILMPPEAFYPAKSLKRPEFGIPTLRDSINIRAATLHLWLTTWAGARGAKNGSCG